jgi:uncharacterized protein YlaI
MIGIISFNIQESRIILFRIGYLDHADSVTSRLRTVTMCDAVHSDIQSKTPTRGSNRTVSFFPLQRDAVS